MLASGFCAILSVPNLHVGLAGAPPQAGKRGQLFARFAGVHAFLHLTETVLKHGVVRDGFLDELLEQEKLGAVYDRMDALLKSLHGREGLERVTKQNDSCMTTMTHLHSLERLEREILLRGVGGKTLFDNHDLIAHLAEADQKVAMGGGRVNLIAQFLQRGLGRFQPFGC